MRQLEPIDPHEPAAEEKAAVAIQKHARSHFHRLKSSVSVMRVMNSSLKTVRVTRMSDLPLELARQSGRVTMTASDESALQGLRLWEQGDQEMYGTAHLPDGVCTTA